jgi:hypothetical protein
MSDKEADTMMKMRGVEDASLRELVKDLVGTLPLHVEAVSFWRPLSRDKIVEEADYSKKKFSYSLSSFFSRNMSPQTWDTRVGIVRNLLDGTPITNPTSKLLDLMLSLEKDESSCSSFIHSVIAYNTDTERWEFASKMAETEAREWLRRRKV